MKKITAVILTCFICALSLILPVKADENRWELSGFGGGHFTGHLKLASEASDSESNSGNDQLDLSNGSAFGVTVGRDIDAESAWEVMWMRENTGVHATGGSAPSEDLGALTIDQFHFNGLYYPPQAQGPVRWFALGGIGASVFSPIGDYGTTTEMSLSIGTGAKVKLKDNLGLRFDARWTGTPFYSQHAIACASGPAGGACYVASSGQILQQIELTGGVYYRI